MQVLFAPRTGSLAELKALRRLLSQRPGEYALYDRDALQPHQTGMVLSDDIVFIQVHA